VAVVVDQRTVFLEERAAAAVFLEAQRGQVHPGKAMPVALELLLVMARLEVRVVIWLAVVEERPIIITVLVLVVMVCLAPSVEH
jgi:hypothetical protein